MKRDMDLVREILMYVEESAVPGDLLDEIEIAGRSREDIYGHIAILIDAHMIEAENLSDLSGDDYRVERLTWHGHEFIEAARSETRWNEAKTRILKSGSSMTISVIVEVLKKLALEALP